MLKIIIRGQQGDSSSDVQRNNPQSRQCGPCSPLFLLSPFVCNVPSFLFRHLFLLFALMAAFNSFPPLFQATVKQLYNHIYRHLKSTWWLPHSCQSSPSSAPPPKKKITSKNRNECRTLPNIFWKRFVVISVEVCCPFSL